MFAISKWYVSGWSAGLGRAGRAPVAGGVVRVGRGGRAGDLAAARRRRPRAARLRRRALHVLRRTWTHALGPGYAHCKLTLLGFLCDEEMWWVVKVKVTPIVRDVAGLISEKWLFRVSVYLCIWIDYLWNSLTKFLKKNSF